MPITIKKIDSAKQGHPFLFYLLFLKNTIVLQGLTDTDKNINKYKEFLYNVYNVVIVL